MDISQLIGFIISAGALLFLFFRQFQTAKRRRENPEQYEQEQRRKEKHLKELMKSLDIETDDEEENERELPLQPKPVKIPHKVIKPALRHSAVAKVKPPIAHVGLSTHNRAALQSASAYKITHRNKPSRGSLLVHGLRSPQEMIIFQAIVGTPKSLS